MRSVKLCILYTLKYIFSIVIYLAEIVAAMVKHFVIHLNSFFSVMYLASRDDLQTLQGSTGWLI